MDADSARRRRARRDGLFFIAGCGSFAISLTYFTLVALGGGEAMDKLRQLFAGG